VLMWLVRELHMRFINDDLPSAAAQVTFFLVLSLPAFLIFLITLISYMPITGFDSQFEILKSFMPINAYEIVRGLIEQILADRSRAILSFGMLLALWSSLKGVASLIRGINRAYDQEETRPLWQKIIVELLFTLQLTGVIIFSLILIVGGKALGVYFFQPLGFSVVFLEFWSNMRIIFVLFTAVLVFTALYRNVPNRKLKFADVLPGAFFAAIFWVAVSLAFSYYANNLGQYASFYGSLGGIIALLLWTYFNSIILLMGAELNAALMFAKTGSHKKRYMRF